jgi:hypothetical protein
MRELEMLMQVGIAVWLAMLAGALIRIVWICIEEARRK